MKESYLKICLVFIASAIPLIAFNQISTFEKHYDTLGCYYANCVRQTFDGGFMMFGSSYNSSTQQDVAIIKTDSLGNLLWVKTYGGPSTDGAISAVITTDSNYMVVGLKDASIDNSIWLLKINDNGDTLWTKTLTLGQGDNAPTAIENTFDGGYVLTGRCTARSHGALDVYLIKLNSIGDTLWSRIYGGISSDEAYSVKQINDSGIVICGATGSFGAGSDDFYIIKTDLNGDTVWTRTFGDINVDVAKAILQTSDTGYIVGGYSWNIPLHNYDIYLVKLNMYGDSLWTKRIGNILENGLDNLQITSDGGFILVGTTRTNNNGYDAYLVRTDSNGDTLWSKTFGGSLSEHGYYVQQTSDGGFVLTGSSDSYVPNSVYLVKTDSLGKILSGINELENENNFYVFPNPASDRLYIKSFKQNGFKKVNFYIVDLFGKKLFQGEIESGEMKKEINVVGLNSGIYFIVLTEKNSIVQCNKIIIQH